MITSFTQGAGTSKFQLLSTLVGRTGGSFATTKGNLDIASHRARNLAAISTAFDDTEPSTDIVELVALLIAFGN